MIFGRVYAGIDTVDKIAAVKTNAQDKPLEDVIINSIDVSTF
ncbi:MAG: peptidylprolyl isomerase [Firmicutes bacterium]|nr:peptidylprolyl isomerase [Bacillota bacterium]